MARGLRETLEQYYTEKFFNPARVTDMGAQRGFSETPMVSSHIYLFCGQLFVPTAGTGALLLSETC